MTQSSAGPNRWGDRRHTRVGLLGGSFNPAHEGHRRFAAHALRRLGLDQVWLMVSPGNPLKPADGMAPLADRLRTARSIADGRHVVATDIERHLHTRYTADTLTALRQRFPHVRFVWLMGADNLRQMPHWQRWMRIARTMPIAVHPRPSYNERALAGQAAHRMRRFRHPARIASALADLPAPAWTFLAEQQSALSATQLRTGRVTPRPQSRYSRGVDRPINHEESSQEPGHSTQTG